jgi:hypothetical protein
MPTWRKPTARYLEALRLDPDLARSCDHLGQILHHEG